MPYRMLYIFVEGPDDRRFIEKIVKPKVSNSYQYVSIQEYKSQRSKDKEFFRKFIQNIKNRSQDYLFFADINNAPCVSQKKQNESQIYHNVLEVDRIIIVIKEIESWYKAGLDYHSCQKYKIRFHSDTNELTKEDFNKEIPRNFDRLTFMLDILNCYSIEAAIRSNSSLGYFIARYCNPSSPA